MWPMSGAIWWLSYQRTSVPISAITTAAQAMPEPRRCAVLSVAPAGFFTNMPIQ
jgi:hypothetical protein